jgi:hypothetical protein
MTATTTATRTARPAAVPTLTRMTDGKLLLSDVPFMLPGIGRDGAAGRSGPFMGARGLGWEFKKFDDGVKGWVSSEAGAGREAVAALGEIGVAVVDITGAKAPAKRAAAKAPAARKATPAKREASIMSNAETAAYGARATLAATIAAALTADGVHPDVIAAAITAATAAADKIAKSVSATVSAPAPAAKVRKASAKDAPVTVRKVTPAKATPVKASRPSGEAVTAARKALTAAKITGVSVRKSGEAFRADGAPVGADALTVIAAAIAAA